MAFEKLKKTDFITPTYNFKAVDCGDIVLVDTSGYDKVDYKTIQEETKDHPKKDKLIFFEFDYIQKFNVSVEGKKYFLRYKLENGEKITSNQAYTEAEINSCYFIALTQQNADFLGYMTTNLRQVAPENFQFSVILNTVKVLLIDDTIDVIN